MTPRQKVLLERLKTLCERASSGTLLPARVVSVWGYGSYFRNKDRPRDADVDVVIDRSGPGFELQRLLYDRFDEATHGYDDPKDGVKEYFGRLRGGDPCDLGLNPAKLFEGHRIGYRQALRDEDVSSHPLSFPANDALSLLER
ncbi:MAG: hypothetical protein ABSG92_09240 [Conexivisphaerales archaeon]|jgi:hypothetical protein